MTDVNEEIVKTYYEAQGYLVKTNQYYVKKKYKDDKKTGQGASDIDLIIMHPITEDKSIVSVKGWQNDKVTKKNINKTWKQRVYSKLNIDKQTLDAGERFFRDKNFKKILILPCIENNNYKSLVKELKEFYGYDEIIDFPNILKDIIEGNKERDMAKFNQSKNYKDSEFLQTLRILLKYYSMPLKKSKTGTDKIVRQ